MTKFWLIIFTFTLTSLALMQNAFSETMTDQVTPGYQVHRQYKNLLLNFRRSSQDLIDKSSVAQLEGQSPEFINTYSRLVNTTYTTLRPSKKILPYWKLVLLEADFIRLVKVTGALQSEVQSAVLTPYPVDRELKGLQTFIQYAIDGNGKLATLKITQGLIDKIISEFDIVFEGQIKNLDEQVSQSTDLESKNKLVVKSIELKLQQKILHSTGQNILLQLGYITGANEDFMNTVDAIATTFDREILGLVILGGALKMGVNFVARMTDIVEARWDTLMASGIVGAAGGGAIDGLLSNLHSLKTAAVEGVNNENGFLYELGHRKNEATENFWSEVARGFLIGAGSGAVVTGISFRYGKFMGYLVFAAVSLSLVHTIWDFSESSYETATDFMDILKSDNHDQKKEAYLKFTNSYFEALIAVFEAGVLGYLWHDLFHELGPHIEEDTVHMLMGQSSDELSAVFAKFSKLAQSIFLHTNDGAVGLGKVVVIGSGDNGAAAGGVSGKISSFAAKILPSIKSGPIVDYIFGKFIEEDEQKEMPEPELEIKKEH